MKVRLRRFWSSLAARLFVVIVVGIVGSVLAAYGVLTAMDWRAQHRNAPLWRSYVGTGGGPYVGRNGLRVPDRARPFERFSDDPMVWVSGGLPSSETLRSLGRASAHIPAGAYTRILHIVGSRGDSSSSWVVAGEGRVPATAAGRPASVADTTWAHVPLAVVRKAFRRGWAIGTGWYDGTDIESAHGLITDSVAWRDGGGTVRYVFAIRLPGDRPTHQAGGFFTEFIDIHPIKTVFLIGLPVVLGAALVATLLMVRGVIRPVRLAEAAARRLAAGIDPAPLPVTGPREIASLSTSFNDMAQRLSRAQEAEQSFLLSVSHELKTPLTAIQGYGETLTEGRADPKTAGAVITKESGRLMRLVQDVLDLGRARKSTFAVREEPVDLAEVAREVGQRYAEQAREYGLDLEVEAADSAPVRADGDRTLQVVSNLVENALRCTPAGGAVTILVVPSEVHVIDTGPGLVRDDLARAFERFYLYERCAKERQVGSGLGLSIVKELSEAMGGSVAVESRLGEGTTFVVSLPAAEAPG